MPKSHVPKGSLHISLNIMCPALILASSRKHKVIGRTKILIISTSLKKGTKYQGELIGSKLETAFDLIIKRKTLLSQKEKAADKLKERVVVTGYL